MHLITVLIVNSETAGMTISCKTGMNLQTFMFLLLLGRTSGYRTNVLKERKCACFFWGGDLLQLFSHFGFKLCVEDMNWTSKRHTEQITVEPVSPGWCWVRTVRVAALAQRITNTLSPEVHTLVTAFGPDDPQMLWSSWLWGLCSCCNICNKCVHACSRDHMVTFWMPSLLRRQGRKTLEAACVVFTAS